MPPIPPDRTRTKVVIYHQTHHDKTGKLPVSILPVLGLSSSGNSGHGSGQLAARPAVTHIIVGAIHLNDDPNHMTLNDHVPDHPRFDTLWSELRQAQAVGVRVLGMLGGAAKGSYQRLDTGTVPTPAAGSVPVLPSQFETYYQPLAALIRRRQLDGIDLDIEEAMSLQGVVHLIDRLRADFGPSFLITLAPVAAALLYPYEPKCNLSGFSYRDLEIQRGHEIAWYHAQFYCGWGDASQPYMYAAMATAGAGSAGQSLQRHEEVLSHVGLGRATPLGFPPHRVVMGLVTNPANGPGFVSMEKSAEVLMQLQQLATTNGTTFAGVSGWEYFNSLPGDTRRPWEWAEWMAAILGIRDDQAVVARQPEPVPQEYPPFQKHDQQPLAAGQGSLASAKAAELDPDAKDGAEAPVPSDFEYKTDTEED